MTFNLFEEDTLGFHLEFFQVLNWGVFNEKIYTLNLESNSALLTGENGSGKTTIVDALTTLLVPSGLRFYNQSSGASKKRDRSEESYVLGAFGNIQSEEQTSGVQYLRKKENVLSVLNGCFYDKHRQRFVSLLQVRYFSGSELQHVYAVTEQKLSLEIINEALDKNGVSFERSGKWKNVLRSSFGTQFFDSFEKYKICFLELFGLRSDKALKLFSQIVGLKVLGNLTEFIRENMLEKSETDVEFQKLERNYENLLQAEKIILKTKKQMELLEPIIQTGKKLEEAKLEKEKLQRLKGAVPVWSANANIEILQTEVKDIETQIKTQEHIKLTKINEITVVESAIKSLDQSISQLNASRRILQIDNELTNLNQEKERRKQEAEKYKTHAEKLDIKMPRDKSGFEKNLAQSRQMQEEINNEKADYDNRKTTLSVEKREAEKEKNELQRELESLGKRNSNIPERNILIRKKIASAVKCSEEDLPFAGELLQVARKHEDWSFAIERLLHNFALTILVPEHLYKKVTDYVKSNNLGGRLVYIRTLQSVSLMENIVAEENTVPGKLEIKQNHPLSEWLSQYLLEKFNYLCTDDIQEITRAEKALTIKGLIKNGIRHEKDDRVKLLQNGFQVLGWDNTRKRQMLSTQYDELQMKLNNIDKEISEVQTHITNNDEKVFALKMLLDILTYEQIDFESVVKNIDKLNDERKKLAASKDIRVLQEELDKRNDEKKSLENERNEIIELLGGLKTTLISEKTSLSENEELLKSFEVNPDYQTMILPTVQELCSRYPRRTSAKTLSMIKDAAKKIVDELTGNITTQDNSIKGYVTSVRNHIIKIKRPDEKLRIEYGNWESEFNDLGESEDFVGDYKAFYERLKKDDLPKYEKRFHDFLENSIKDDIINFNQFIQNKKEDIENAVQYLNQNLREIKYGQNPDTYLLLKCEKTSDPRIGEFTRKLKSAIPNTVKLVQMDAGYEEHIFKQIKAFLESLKQNQNIREFVLDVRNHFTFAASENYKSDNQQKQYYSDSASLSGGEKAKLTYTILASAISYQFGINNESAKSFRFVIIDEAFSKSDASNSEYAMKLFKQLNLQVMVITPLDKINIVEDYISSVHMTENKRTDDSRLISMTIQKYKQEKEAQVNS